MPVIFLLYRARSEAKPYLPSSQGSSPGYDANNLDSFPTLPLALLDCAYFKLGTIFTLFWIPPHDPLLSCLSLSIYIYIRFDYITIALRKYWEFDNILGHESFEALHGGTFLLVTVCSNTLWFGSQLSLSEIVVIFDQNHVQVFSTFRLQACPSNFGILLRHFGKTLKQ